MKTEGNKNLSVMMIIYFLLLTIVGGSILYSLIKIQWIDGDFWRKKAEEREKSQVVDPAQRGNIYSSDGQILATTIPICNLYIDLGKHTYKDKKGRKVTEPIISDSLFNAGLNRVCSILHSSNPDKPAGYYRNRIMEGRKKSARCHLIQRGIPYSDWMEICQIAGWRKGVVKRVDGENVIRQVRAHIYGSMAENTIGFHNSWASDTYTGLEGYYDGTLRGQDGIYVCRRLTRGVWLPMEHGDDRHIRSEEINEQVIDSLLEQPKINGLDIVSTIDTRYQDIAETSLRKTLFEYGGIAGCAVLMEISTGYVLACSNLSWDTTQRNFIESPDRNVACSEVYEPGSTFKTVVLTAMMNDTTIHLDTAEHVRVGWKTYSKHSGEISDGSHAYVDTVSIPRVLAMSSNVGMCELGWKYYNHRRGDFKSRVQEIFPYQPLGLDVKTSTPKTRPGNLRSDRDFLNFCYGYANQVTVMQMLTFYNALGGKGRMVKPLFCKEIVNGNRRTPIEPVVINEQICSKETAKQITEMLVGVVEHGTGNNIRNSTYSIAGKTGTSQYNYRDHHIYNASFAGFFPADNPKYSCIVVVKRVAAHGRGAAAPVFKKIADCVMAVDRGLGNVKLEMRDTNSLLLAPAVNKGNRAEIAHIYGLLGMTFPSDDTLQQPSQWTYYQEATDSSLAIYHRYAPPKDKIPNCKGMTAKDAINLLHSMGLRAKVQGCGKVIQQTPTARSNFRKGDVVFLRLGN